MHSIIQYFIDRKKTSIILLLIFILAFAIRGHLLQFELLFGFDSYYHARLVGHILEFGFLPENDPLAYYQLGGTTLPAVGTFFWYFNAAIYKIVTLGAPYNKDLLIAFVKVLPAVYGAITSVLMYFLGRELYGKKAGYAMAFFAAVVPAYVYRTMAGFFEEDSFGFIWMIAGLVMFFKAVKVPEFTRLKALYAALAGILFGIMAFAWGLFILVPILLAVYFPFAVLNLYAKQGKQKTIDFVKLFAITFGVFFIISFIADGGNWINTAVNYIVGVVPNSIPLFVVGVAIVLIAMAAYILVATSKKAGPESTNKTLSFISMASMFAVILIIATIFVVVDDYRGAGVLENSVGEENTGKQSFRSKYNALIVFPLLGLLLLPYRLFRRKDEHYSALIFFWIAITLFMSWYKLKFTYTFGLPVAAAAGVVTIELFYFFSTRKDLTTKLAAISLAFMFLVGVAAAAKFVTTQPPNIETDPGWKDALEWMRFNTPKEAKFFNWWDQGHWITFVAERNVFLDNRNSDFDGDRKFASFAIDFDLKKSIAIIDEYDPDYLILAHDMPSKVVSFATYAYNTRDFQQPEIQKFFVGTTNSLRCSNSQVDGQAVYRCGGNTIPIGDMAAIPSTWQETPNQLVDNRIPLYIYRESDNSLIHGINAAVNLTTMVKIYFEHPDTLERFEQVYASNGIKIFKIKK